MIIATLLGTHRYTLAALRVRTRVHHFLQIAANMASPRPDVPRQMKRRLHREAGEKCANPGCSALRTQLHHIQEWHVYQTHDEQHMIAICPSCHDAVHHGALEITDETLYRWKQIRREPSTRGHVYIEPRKNPTVELGTNLLFGPPDGFFAFSLSQRNRWEIRIVESEILLISFSLSALSGQEVLRFRENHWKLELPDIVSLRQVPGHLRITTKSVPDFMPDWVRDAMQEVEPGYATGEELVILDIEVLKPGFVRVEGLWVDEHTAVIATPNGLYFTGESATEELTHAVTYGYCTVDLRQNGVVSPTLFRVAFPDRDPKKFSVTIGYPVPTIRTS